MSTRQSRHNNRRINRPNKKTTGNMIWNKCCSRLIFFHWRTEKNWKGEESKVYIVIFFLIRKKDIIQNQINYLKVTECYVKERTVCDVTNIWNFNCTWILYFKLYLKNKKRKEKSFVFCYLFVSLQNVPRVGTAESERQLPLLLSIPLCSLQLLRITQFQ